MIVRLSDIVPVPQHGTGNMGDVTDRESVARWKLEVPEPGDSYVPTMLKVRAFGGSGVGDLVLRQDHRDGSKLDFPLRTWKDFGVGAAAKYTNIFMRISEDPELRDWQMWRDPLTLILDELVLEWTNPDEGNMEWAAEFGLINAALIRER